MGVVEPGALGHFSLLFHHRQSLHSYPVLTMMVVMNNAVGDNGDDDNGDYDDYGDLISFYSSITGQSLHSYTNTSYPVLMILLASDQWSL